VNFLDLLQELGINNLVFSSSATVYGEGVNAGVPLREEFVSTTQKHITITMEACAAQNLEFELTSPCGRTRFMC
jgi:UDP-glucose 4-epimerase